MQFKRFTGSIICIDCRTGRTHFLGGWCSQPSPVLTCVHSPWEYGELAGTLAASDLVAFLGVTDCIDYCGLPYGMTSCTAPARSEPHRGRSSTLKWAKRPSMSRHPPVSTICGKTFVREKSGKAECAKSQLLPQSLVAPRRNPTGSVALRSAMSATSRTAERRLPSPWQAPIGVAIYLVSAGRGASIEQRTT